MDFLRHYYVGGVSGGGPVWSSGQPSPFDGYANQIKDLYSQYQQAVQSGRWQDAAHIAKQIADLETAVNQSRELSTQEKNNLLAVIDAAKTLQSRAENVAKAYASGDRAQINEALINQESAQIQFQRIWEDRIGA